MQRYIAILRGINVGGHRKILMADLKSLFEKMGFQNISTYIQSGNVLFNAEEQLNKFDLAAAIESQIKSSFSFEVPVIVRTKSEMQAIIKNNPFSKRGIDIKKMHVAFLSNAPTKSTIRKLQEIDIEPEEFYLYQDQVFIYSVEKYHKSKLSTSFFEKNLNVKATTRNWRTVSKLYDLLLKQ